MHNISKIFDGVSDVDLSVDVLRIVFDAEDNKITFERQIGKGGFVFKIKDRFRVT